MMKLFFDGASRGNPGKAAYGFVIKDAGGSTVRYGNGYLGVATNNEAEYEGLIHGLVDAINQKYDKVEIHGDSMLVCKQVLGEWKVKAPNLVPYRTHALKLYNMIPEASISQVPRSENSEADALANQALDKQ